MRSLRRINGFALPTVLITSVTMMILLLASLNSISSIAVGINNQYYDKLATEAAQSGLAMADACINSGITSWPNPLRPGGDCNGLANPCTGANCYVANSANVKTSFSVASPSVVNNQLSVESSATTELTRKSNGLTWKKFNQISKQNRKMNKLFFKQISSGLYNSCAIAVNGKPYCWGRNNAGQLGNNSNTDSSVPVAVDASGVLADKTLRSIAVGNEFVCAIASDNNVYCWGNNIYGQLGNNSFVNSDIPVAVTTSGILSGKTAKELSVGAYGQSACIIASDNSVYCWGSNASGALGNNSTTNSSVAVRVVNTGALSGKTVQSLASGYNHTCVVASDNNAYCWGDNGFGALGNNSSTDSLVPVAVTASGALAGKTIRSIAVANNHACVIASDNNPYCWGNNTGGQLGNNSSTSSSVPVAVTISGTLAGKTARSITSGGHHTCIVASDNNLYCWGIGTSGQLGNGTGTSSSVPVAVTISGTLAGKTIRSVNGGNSSTCVVASDNLLYCWGTNTYGQLGNGSTSSSQSAVAVIPVYGQSYVPIAHDKGIASGSCFLLADLNAYCWGDGTEGQLGDGRNVDSRAAVAVKTSGALSAKTIQALSSGWRRHCALASDNNAYCWGKNPEGQLGNGTTTDSNEPVAVSRASGSGLSGKSVVSIASGWAHACALASDNWVYCWGRGGSALGNGSTTNQTVPIAISRGAIPAGATIRSIDSGIWHTCVIASDNKAYCWGAGGLGNGSTSSSVPVAVSQGALPAGGVVRDISVGDYRACVIASDNRPYCWGSDTGSNTPVAIGQGQMPSPTVNYINDGSGQTTCAIASDNNAYCWGRNPYGQFGDGTRGNSSTTPVAVDRSGLLSGKTITSIQVGFDSVCSIASDNNAYCWGANGGYQLGSSFVGDRPNPVLVTQLPNISGSDRLRY